MKNKKFSITFIERGRLTEKENKEINGGAAGSQCTSSVFFCQPQFMVQGCALYTSCSSTPTVPQGYQVCCGDYDLYNTICSNEIYRKKLP